MFLTKYCFKCVSGCGLFGFSLHETSARACLILLLLLHFSCLFFNYLFAFSENVCGKMWEANSYFMQNCLKPLQCINFSNGLHNICCCSVLCLQKCNACMHNIREKLIIKRIYSVLNFWRHIVTC